MVRTCSLISRLSDRELRGERSRLVLPHQGSRCHWRLLAANRFGPTGIPPSPSRWRHTGHLVGLWTQRRLPGSTAGPRVPRGKGDWTRCRRHWRRGTPVCTTARLWTPDIGTCDTLQRFFGSPGTLPGGYLIVFWHHTFANSFPTGAHLNLRWITAPAALYHRRGFRYYCVTHTAGFSRYPVQDQTGLTILTTRRYGWHRGSAALGSTRTR